MRTLAALAFLMAAACGSQPSTATDLSTVGDLAGADLASAPRDCRATACRAYSSGCSTMNTCVCLALTTDEPDPRCDGAQVSCLIDPCDGKSAVCNPTTQRCEIQPR